MDFILYWVRICSESGYDVVFCSLWPKRFFGIFIGIALRIYVTTLYISLGKSREFENPMNVFDYFCGKYLGKLVATLTVIYALFGPSVMIFGFGATISQLTGVSATVGSIIMDIVVIGTVILGLQKIADIIGTLGLVLIIVSLVTGGLYLAGNWWRLMVSAEKAAEMELLSIGDNWFMGSVYFCTWAPLIAALFLTVLFIGVIILGIYSSAVPGMFTFVVTQAKEKTKRYYIVSVTTGIFVTIVTMLIPFDTLTDLLFSVYGAF